MASVLHRSVRARGGVAAVVLCALVFLAAFVGPALAPQNPFDLADIDLSNASIPPAWLAAGDPRFLLGTDDQGRDILSAILYGARISLLVSLSAVVLAMLLGTAVGLLSGWYGGIVDAVTMRIADVQLTFPALLVALLIDGLIRGAIGGATGETTALLVVIAAIALSLWVQFARMVRALTMVEAGKPYVDAGRLIGARPARLLLLHVLPNIAGPIFVMATLDLAFAIVVESTLSYLGVGVSAARPSLGTLIRLGSDFLYSGAWWMTVFPGAALFVIVLAVNLLGDRWRDAIDPRLQ